VMLEAFVKCLDVVGDNAFNTEQLEKLAKGVGSIFSDYREFIDSQNEQKKDADFDEEEEERINEDISSYEEALANVADLLGRLVKHHGPAFLPIFQPILKPVLDFIKPTASIAERHIAICIVDDIVQYGGKSASVLFPLVMSFYFDYINDKDPAIRQAIVFGLGIFAQVGQEAFYPYVSDTLARLHAVCGRHDARSEEFAMATDNAISAIGRICVVFGNQLDLGQILPVWLQYLPILADDEEALVVYNNLCDFVEKTGAQLSGSKYENVPKLVGVFGQILGTKFVDEELTQRITTIIKGMQQLPPEVSQNAWASLSPTLQEKLQKILSGQ